MVATFINTVQALQGDPWSAPIFLSVYVAACLVWPIGLFPIAGGILFGFWGGVACNMTAGFLGSQAAFFLARKLGRNFVERWMGERLKKFDASMGRYGFGVLLTARLLGIPPFVILNYLAGLSSVSWPAYTASTLLGILPWTLVVTYFAGVFWRILLTSGLQGYRDAWLEYAGPILSAAGIAALAGLLAYLRLRRNQAVGISRE